MSLDHKAIYKSHLTVVRIDDSAGAFDAPAACDVGC